MVRGTTPTLTLRLKRRVIDLSTVSRYILTFKQPFVELTIDSNKDDFKIDVENGVISTSLTQEQTFKLMPGTAEVQLKLVIRDTIYSTRAKRIKIHESLSHDRLEVDDYYG